MLLSISRTQESSSLLLFHLLCPDAKFCIKYTCSYQSCYFTITFSPRNIHVHSRTNLYLGPTIRGPAGDLPGLPDGQSMPGLYRRAFIFRWLCNKIGL